MYAELVDSMASDENVVNAAKVSTLGSDSRNLEAEEGLIRYLMREHHASPFEHNVFTFFVEAPIFVTREILRHRISSINEESGRYKELSDHFYFPTDRERPLRQVGKTGHYIFEPAEELRDPVLELMDEAYTVAWDNYSKMLRMGVAKEVARMVLPVGIYSSMYFTINARSLMNFLSLRTADNAQWEIRQVARDMEVHFERKMPITYKAWNEFGRKSI